MGDQGYRNMVLIDSLCSTRPEPRSVSHFKRLVTTGDKPTFLPKEGSRIERMFLLQEGIVTRQMGGGYGTIYIK